MTSLRNFFVPLFLIIVFILLSDSGLSQYAIVYENNFNHKYTDWKTGKNSKVLNGVFQFASDKNNVFNMYFKQIFIDFNRNYSIETRIKQVGGAKNAAYGLVWGALGWTNSYIFVITSSGYFSVGKYKNKKYIELKKWTKSKLVNGFGKYNKLKISAISGIWYFSINDQIVWKTKELNFYGQFHGFVSMYGSVCQADYFRIRCNQPPVRTAGKKFAGTRHNLGKNINTYATEIAPIISPDGRILYFARGNYSGNIYGSADESDIWFSERQPDGSWGPAKNIGKPLNNSGVNVVVNAMPDGNTLYLEGLYNSDGSFRSDQGISVTHKKADGTWEVPKQVKIDNFYNKNIFETYFFTADQKVLIMSIERDDTYGDLDLYVSFRRPDGSYTEPKNMGPDINTFADEGTPFLAPDGKTLYFSTSGRSGYGSDDIFVTRRLDDTWLHWSEPLNLGPVINTKDWDTYFSLSARGDTAFLASTTNSYGNEDLFTIKLNEQAQPDKVIIVYGRVLDKDTKKPIAAQINYDEMKTGKNLGIANSNPATGKYKIVLPYGKKYAFRAKANGYIATSENIDLTKKGDYKEIKKDLYLSKIDVGQVIELHNVLFKIGTAELLPESFPELNRIVKIMKDNPTMRIQLRGHTDNVGDPDQLMELSQKRVDAVKKYLVQKGIVSSRIETKAFGGTMPINKDNSPSERAKNRRVEFKILHL